MICGVVAISIDAQEAVLRNNYKNTQLKLLKTSAAIWFIKICKNQTFEAQLHQHQNQWKKTKGQEKILVATTPHII
jgi:hypothetical protein